MKKYPVVSVGITTYGRTKVFEDTLRSIRSQNYPHNRIEVIVVDANANDSLRTTIYKILDNEMSIRYFHRPSKSISASRREIVCVADGDIIVKLDDDEVLKTDFIEKLVKKLNEDYDIVAYRRLDPHLKGRSILGPNSTLIPVLNHRDAQFFAGYGFWRHLSDNLSFDTYFQVGYEDIDFWLTAKEKGFKATVEYEAIAYHRGKKSVIASRQCYHPRIIRDRLYFNFKHNRPQAIRSWLGFLVWEARLLLREIKNTIIQRDRFSPWLIWGFIFERVRGIKTCIESITVT